MDGWIRTSNAIYIPASHGHLTLRWLVQRLEERSRRTALLRPPVQGAKYAALYVTRRVSDAGRYRACARRPANRQAARRGDFPTPPARRRDQHPSVHPSIHPADRPAVSTTPRRYVCTTAVHGAHPSPNAPPAATSGAGRCWRRDQQRAAQFALCTPARGVLVAAAAGPPARLLAEPNRNTAGRSGAARAQRAIPACVSAESDRCVRTDALVP